jgi:hypothetical protein
MSIGIQSQFQLLLLGCYFRLCHRLNAHRLDAGINGAIILTMIVLFQFGRVEKKGGMAEEMNLKLEKKDAVEGD